MAILQRIIDCAHAGKVVLIDQLKVETACRSGCLEQYGAAVLEIVQSIYPPPAVPILVAALEVNVLNMAGVSDAGDAAAAQQAMSDPNQTLVAKVPSDMVDLPLIMKFCGPLVHTSVDTMPTQHAASASRSLKWTPTPRKLCNDNLMLGPICLSDQGARIEN
ncbi:hypothetical protein BKA93DRAFT_836972 [Sparassis latifolia]